MQSLRSPNIVLFMGVCPSPACIVTEYCSRKSLLDVMRQAGPGNIPWARRLSMLLDAALGVNFLHAHKPQVVHRVSAHWQQAWGYGWGYYLRQTLVACAGLSSTCCTLCAGSEICKLFGGGALGGQGHGLWAEPHPERRRRPVVLIVFSCAQQLVCSPPG